MRKDGTESLKATLRTLQTHYEYMTQYICTFLCKTDNTQEGIVLEKLSLKKAQISLKFHDGA